MDKKAFSEIEGRLLEVNKVVAKLDQSIRVAAFEFLKPYVSGGSLPAAPDEKKHSAEHGSTTDISELVEKHGEGKPSDNITLLAAIWFAEYGSSAFSVEYLREKASGTGLTIPTRPDMTLRQAKDKGKALFAPAGRGLFKPTVVGEAFFKSTYNVKKGTKAPPTTEK